MKKFKLKKPSEATRAYLYNIAISIVFLLVMYGYLTEEQGVAWLGLGAAALGGLGMARANVTTKSKVE